MRRAERGPVDGAERLVEAVRGAEREPDRQAHVGHRQLGDRGAVGELDHAVDRPTAGARRPRCWSKSTPNSSWASITSRPLFISVDESMVIFGPMVQVGCFERVGDGHRRELGRGLAPERSAARGEDDLRDLARRARSAAPGRPRSARSRPARSRRRPRRAPWPRPARRRSGSPCSRARAACRASSAASVAGSPAKPTTAFSTTSASGSAASSASTSGVSPASRARSAGTPNSSAWARERFARCDPRRARRPGTRRDGPG